MRLLLWSWSGQRGWLEGGYWLQQTPRWSKADSHHTHTNTAVITTAMTSCGRSSRESTQVTPTTRVPLAVDDTTVLRRRARMAALSAATVSAVLLLRRRRWVSVGDEANVGWRFGAMLRMYQGYRGREGEGGCGLVGDVEVDVDGSVGEEGW